MKKNTLKSVFAALAVSAIAVSATSVAASASDYADQIKTGKGNKEVAYDGSAYTTTLDTTNATQAQIIIEKKELEYSASLAGSQQDVKIAVSGANKKYASVQLHFLYDTRLTAVQDEDEAWVTYDGKLGSENRKLGDGELFIAHDGSSDKGTDGDAVWTLHFTLPSDVKAGDLYPIGIEYRSSAVTEDCFTNADDDNDGKLMQAYVFTKGITNGYIKIGSGTTTSTTTTTTTTTTPTTTTTTSTSSTTSTTSTSGADTTTTTTGTGSTTAASSTTTQNDAPPTGVAGVGVAAAGLAVAIGTAFVLRKKED
ncbi:MAG: NPXTG-anchored protein [Ruminococcus sp.]|nr:NPXTG-anchored protein [Ruminococcus sp.]